MTVFNNFHNEQILKLDVKQQQANAIPRVVQYDSALLKIELYDNGKLYDVSRATEFVVSIKRPDGKEVSGLATYDGEFINYKLTKQDMEKTGEHEARLQVYESRHRLSSLSFRYDVYEDFESVGDPEEQTLLSQLFTRLHDALTEAQRQGNYAENRGDFANDAGDYAIDAGDSQKMRWLMYVKTISERDEKYPNPQNGDTVYVVNVGEGGAVYRFNGIQQPAKWEEISGYDTSIIQDIYNVLSTKETKVKVKEIADKLKLDLANTRFGGRNLLPKTEVVEENLPNFKPVGIETNVTKVSSTAGDLIQVRKTSDEGTYHAVNLSFSTSDNITLDEDREYTLSFIGQNSLTSNAFDYVYLMRSDGDNQKLYLTRSYEVATYDVGTLTKYEFTFKPDWSTEYGYVLIGATSKDTYTQPYWLRIKDVKLEHGNRATDWSPAFEDLINGYKALVSDLKKEKDGDVSRHNSRIKQLEDKIVMTVEEQKYNDAMKLIGEWQSEYEQTARNIKTTVSEKVGKNEIASVINQTAQSVLIDANKINMNGYVSISNLRDGKTKVHPNALADFGMTTIDGGTITIDKLNVRRKNGKDMMVLGSEIIADYSAQRYEPDFSAIQNAHENGRVWNPKGQYFRAPLVAIYGQGGHPSWANYSQYDDYTDARGEDLYTLVQAYAVRQNARYLVVSYGVQTQHAGIMVRVAETASSGSGLLASRVHNYRDEDSVWGGTYRMVLDLESLNSNFGSRRLFYVKATGVNSDRALNSSATRECKIRILGVYTTDNP